MESVHLLVLEEGGTKLFLPFVSLKATTEPVSKEKELICSKGKKKTTAALRSLRKEVISVGEKRGFFL